MVIEKNFIKNIVDSFYASIISDEHRCDAASMEPINDSYNNETYQKVYALKYLPAYYFEYCKLADLLKYKCFFNEYTSINIASIGCGLSPDYYALLNNLQGITFSYIGFDATSWKMQDLMPPKNQNFLFKNKSVLDITNEELSDIDVYIFPKSIGDIAKSNNSAINRLASLIASTNKNNLFFLNSFASSDYTTPPDVYLFKDIHEKLLMSKFYTCHDFTKTKYLGENGRPGLWNIDNNFEYPNDKFIACDYKGTKNLCENCKVVSDPILTNRYMSFQLLEYKR